MKEKFVCWKNCLCITVEEEWGDKCRGCFYGEMEEMRRMDEEGGPF
jgi:hypothetical protein